MVLFVPAWIVGWRDLIRVLAHDGPPDRLRLASAPHLPDAERAEDVERAVLAYHDPEAEQLAGPRRCGLLRGVTTLLADPVLPATSCMRYLDEHY